MRDDKPTFPPAGSSPEFLRQKATALIGRAHALRERADEVLFLSRTLRELSVERLSLLASVRGSSSNVLSDGEIGFLKPNNRTLQLHALKGEKRYTSSRVKVPTG